MSYARINGELYSAAVTANPVLVKESYIDIVQENGIFSKVIADKQLVEGEPNFTRSITKEELPELLKSHLAIDKYHTRRHGLDWNKFQGTEDENEELLYIGRMTSGVLSTTKYGKPFAPLVSQGTNDYVNYKKNSSYKGYEETEEIKGKGWKMSLSDGRIYD